VVEGERIRANFSARIEKTSSDETGAAGVRLQRRLNPAGCSIPAWQNCHERLFQGEDSKALILDVDRTLAAPPQS